MVSYSDINEFEIKYPRLFLATIVITYTGLFIVYIKYNL